MRVEMRAGTMAEMRADSKAVSLVEMRAGTMADSKVVS